MSKLVTLSIDIDEELQEALTEFCHKKGLRIQHFVEKAILDQLEDQIDIDAYLERKDEEEVPFGKIIKRR